MIRAFLSHSSKDKASYVSVVASRLDKENVVYDEVTFEAGEKTLSEIIKGLDKSDVFVLFLSRASVASPWVQEEITQAHLRLSDGRLKEVFPILIDAELAYDDPNIPAWISKNYNLRLITRPSVAARRIHQKLRQASWARHPKLAERASLFIGRNSAVERFEQRFDNFDLPKPFATVVAGVASIGRRTFLRHAMQKAGIVPASRPLPTVYLDRNGSLEDFILQILDTGYINESYVDLRLFEISQAEKLGIAARILTEIVAAGEVLFVLDDGCLVTYQKELAEWFQLLLESPELPRNPMLFVAGSRTLNPSVERRLAGKVWSLTLPELDDSERRRLLNRLLEIAGLRITPEDFEVLSGLLHGYPEEVYFAADLVERFGARGARDRAYEITEFNSEKASVMLKKYDGNEVALDFIRLLAQFEVFSLDFLFAIVSEATHATLLSDLLAEHICEQVGTDGEFVRLNDSVRDYIKRNRLNVSTVLSLQIKEEVVKLVSESEWDTYDSFRVIFAIREAIKSGIPIDEQYLIPSHFLRAMKDIYHQRGSMDRIVELADQVLVKERSIDVQLVQDIRYYLCLALARRKDRRVLEEVQKVKGDEHDFVLGYYYRLCGRHRDAIERLTKILNAKWVGSRAKRELVEVYIQLEQYDEAIGFARKNYEENRGNQFHVHAYFRCLIYGSSPEQKAEQMERLCSELDAIGSDQARQMAMIGRALVTARCYRELRALDLIDDAIHAYPDVIYPVLAKFDIALQFKDAQAMGDAVKLAGEFQQRGMNVSERTLDRQRAYLKAVEGDAERANQIMSKYVKDFPDEARNRLQEKFRQLAEGSGAAAAPR